MMTGPRTELLVILLLISRCSPGLPDLDLVEEAFSDLGDLDSLGRDFSQIYTGWVNSSFIYPYYLKVRMSQSRQMPGNYRPIINLYCFRVPPYSMTCTGV